MHVEIVTFPETRVAAIGHRGSPATEHETARRLVAWKLEHGLRDPVANRSYGVHYTNSQTAGQEHRVDFCLSVDFEVEPNAYGIVTKTIPAARCARARHLGSRARNTAAVYLYTIWLPASGETAADFPIIFHYVNVGPQVQEAEMITDVYLPLK